MFMNNVTVQCSLQKKNSKEDYHGKHQAIVEMICENTATMYPTKAAKTGSRLMLLHNVVCAHMGGQC